MDTTNRHAFDALSLLLQRDGSRFEYMQVVRLLRLLGVRVQSAAASPKLRTGAVLDLSIGAGEVQAVERSAQGDWRVSARCFGLYGPSSPLPVYYTEDLLDEQREGRSAARGVFDLLHHALYPLLFESWEKYRIGQRVVEAGDARGAACLYAFAGLADPALLRRWSQARVALLRNLALLQQGPRSASGLQRMLGANLHPAIVRVQQHVRGLFAIPAEQRNALGRAQHQLGVDLRLGSVVDDQASTLVIHVQELGAEDFRQLLPGGAGRRRLQALLQLYLREPLRILLQLQLRGDAGCPGLRLGAARWTRVGLDAWLGHAGQGLRSPMHIQQEAARRESALRLHWPDAPADLQATLVVVECRP